MEIIEQLYKHVCVARMSRDRPEPVGVDKPASAIKGEEWTKGKDVTLRFAEDKATENDFFVIESDFLLEQIEEFLLGRRSVVLLDLDEAERNLQNAEEEVNEQSMEGEEAQKTQEPEIVTKKEPAFDNGLPDSVPPDV